MNVLAWLDSLHTTEADGAVTNRKWPEAQEARAAVAEMVEAANAGSAMRTDRGHDALYFGPDKANRLLAAVARVSGGAA